MEIKNEQSRTRDIVDVIISGINKGTFVPGQRLPSQREMADLFGVSRTVIREAIKILEGRYIVQSKQGSGIYVCDLPNNRFDDTDTDGNHEFAMNVRDLLEVSWMFWHESIRLMARNATTDEIKVLTDMIVSMHKRLPKSTVQERYIYETTFGRITSNYSHNPLMHKLMNDLFIATSDFDYLVVANLNKYTQIVDIDLKIAEALQERDGERAYRLQFERDRIILSILSEQSDVLKSTYCIKFCMKPIKNDGGK